jgi:hypothetical protein
MHSKDMCLPPIGQGRASRSLPVEHRAYRALFQRIFRHDYLDCYTGRALSHTMIIYGYR